MSEDHQHKIQEQLPEIDYCPNDSPPWPQTILLGFQHFLTMIGTTVLIPSLVVGNMGATNEQKARVYQTLLFASGINTLIQTFVGTRLPVVVGGSFAYIIPITSITNSPRLRSIYYDHDRFVHTIRAVQGAVILSSILQIILGFSGLWGIMLKYISPTTYAPAIILLGLGFYEYGFPGIAKCVEIGLPALIILLLFSQYFKALSRKKLPVFERFPIIVTVIISWAYAYILTVSGAYRAATEKGKDHCRTDRAHLVGSSPWIRLPYPLQWGAPTFDGGYTFAMMASALVAQIESTAAIYAVSRLANATPPPPFVVGRGIGWLGFGTLLNGLFGTVVGPTISPENAGLVGITRVGSRRTVQIAAIFMLVFSILGKFGAVIASIPQSIVAAIYCVTFAVLAAVGISYLQFVNLNITRNLFILGFALFMGFSVPQYFYEFRSTSNHGPVNTNAEWFNDILNTLFSSNVLVGFVLAVLLDSTLKAHKKDRGMGWWKKYHKWDHPTNEEFYKLPLNMNRYFPPPHY
ncbi:hypothetical protein SELMODRAFT_159848 [Selaginella moellendorffii]|uniref:Uncharacterized protein n=1 Tax=Selaginella moellendorffii TaxID=88036 RepID=D8T060_SELML|nr:nucleobase-ascorbate transporter 1 [Selaginella moellendorffii]EFJ09964.1 hypothetical protein SELMODRAFT_159848 [Selaginella moellendorffii]|eukprot:XP_002988935.1 nucleobase-ascorbate transporter 1 [Selaginella moellendorffii]